MLTTEEEIFLNWYRLDDVQIAEVSKVIAIIRKPLKPIGLNEFFTC